MTLRSRILLLLAVLWLVPTAVRPEASGQDRTMAGCS